MEKLEALNWITVVLQKNQPTNKTKQNITKKNPQKTNSEKTKYNCSKLGAAIVKTRKKFLIGDFWIPKKWSERISLQNPALHSPLALHLNSFPVLCSALNSFWSRICFPTHDIFHYTRYCSSMQNNTHCSSQTDLRSSHSHVQLTRLPSPKFRRRKRKTSKRANKSKAR